MIIVGETVAGAGTSWALDNSPVPNTVALYAGGIRLTPGSDSDYTIDSLGNIVTIGNYGAGTLQADYQTNYTAPVQVGNDILSPFALTTLQRVKDRIFDPSNTVDLTGATVTSNSPQITNIAIPAGQTIRVGQTITGTGIPVGTTIAAIVSDSAITLSQKATLDNIDQTLSVLDQPTAFDGVLIRMINAVTNYINNECGRFSFVQQSYVNDTYSIDNPRQTFLLLRNTPVFSISSFQWRAGTPTNPNWTDFIADQFELVDPRTDPISGLEWFPSGEVRVYGVLPRLYSNMIRASYVGGYPVNWTNAEDHNTHWLPGDLTDTCENLVVRRFLRRQNGGKSSTSLEGATTSWRSEIDAEDLDVIAQYRQLNF